MAVVHLGRTLGVGGFARTVAIKRLLPQYAKDPEFAAMFLDEARLASRVRHPNVVGVLDVVASQGELLMVMEYLAGEALSSIQRVLKPTQRTAPAGIASRILIDALAGLHAAHIAKAEDGRPLMIIHRDVTPHNVIVGEDGVTRMIDFGIAHASVRSHSTRQGDIKGKLRYMAPEQLRGEQATQACDVYSASVVLWETLTGRRLFDADSDAAAFGLVLEGVVRKPSELTRVPRTVDEVVMRGLDKDPSKRFRSAAELAAALEHALPPAGARDVATWLQEVAGPTLARRAHIVASVESNDAIEPPTRPMVSYGTSVESVTLTNAPSHGSAPSPAVRASTSRPPPPAEITSSDRALESTPPSAPPSAPPSLPSSISTSMAAPAPARRRRWALVAFAAAALGIASAALTARQGHTSGVARRGVTEAALLLALRTQQGSAIASAAPKVTAVASEDVPADPTPAETSSAHVRTSVGGTPLPASKKASPDASAHPCDPPYYVDEIGIRRVKRECL
jgi:serine/threonine-protein kinase